MQRGGLLRCFPKGWGRAEGNCKTSSSGASNSSSLSRLPKNHNESLKQVHRIGAVRKVAALPSVVFQGFIPSPLRCWVGGWAEAAWGADPGFILQREADSCTGAFAWRGVVSTPEGPQVPAELAAPPQALLAAASVSGPPNDQHSRSPVLAPSPVITSFPCAEYHVWADDSHMFVSGWPWSRSFLLDNLPGTGT